MVVNDRKRDRTQKWSCPRSLSMRTSWALRSRVAGSHGVRLEMASRLGYDRSHVRLGVGLMATAMSRHNLINLGVRWFFLGMS